MLPEKEAPAVEQVPESAPAPESAPEAAPEKVAAEAKPLEGSLTSENFKEQVEKFKKKDGKAPKEKVAPAATEEKPVAAAPGEEKSAGDAEVKAASQEYKLNPKFTARGTEYTLPKWAQASIKDSTSEREVKEVFEKAQAMDHFKQRNQELFETHEKVSNDYKEIVGGVQELREIYQTAIQSGNHILLDDFFGKLKIDPSVILQYAIKKAEWLQLPPEQRNALDAQTEQTRELRALRQQAAAYQSQAGTATVQARTMALDSVLAKPDIASMVQAFESTAGRKPGDFKQRVWDHGFLKWERDKVDLTPEQAVTEVLQLFAVQPVATPAQAAAPVQMNSAPQAPTVQPHRDVPTIPTVSGRSGASPMQRKPKTVEDLVALRRKMVSG